MRKASEPLGDGIAEALQRGDRDVLALLYDLHGGIAYSLAMRILGDSGAAEEVVQDSFLAVWNRASTFDHTRGSFRAWLLTAVRNRAIDQRRGRWAKHRAVTELPHSLPSRGEGSDPFSELSAKEARSVVCRALQDLPSSQRAAIEMAYFEGLTQREISDRLKTPLGTIKGRMRLGMQRMSGSLELRELQAAR